MKRVLVMCLCFFTILSLAEEQVTEQHDIPYKGEEELDVSIEFGLGKLELRSSSNQKFIMQSEITYTKELYKPKIELWGRSKNSETDIKNNHWRIAMTEQIPSTYDIELGLGKGILDFSNIKISDLNLECGLSDVVVEFNEANKERIRTMVIQTGLGNVEAIGLSNTNMDRFDVECGLGSTKLRFDGDLRHDIKGNITIGLGSVTVEIPKKYAVQIEAESSFLSSLNFDGFREVEEDIYHSKNWKNAERRIYITVEIGLGSVDIDWID